MKRLLLLLMLITQTACASSVEIRILKDYEGIDKEFIPYIQEFIYASKGKINKRSFNGFTMGFRNYKSYSVVGTCHPIAYEVDISRKWWENNVLHSQSQKLELVFHELGHCILTRGHTKKPTDDDFAGWIERVGFKIGLFEEKSLLSDGCPASFMHPYTLGDKCINKHFKYYIDELFKIKRKNHVERPTNITRNPSHKPKCGRPTVINKTKTWVKADENIYRRAKQTCAKRYHGCLKTFYKYTNLSYGAICE